jgi:hypothetical protein
MKPKTIKAISFALLGLLLFLAVLILFRLYKGNEVPTQFAGALLGAIVTAAITMALLHGQTQAEETKERNVKVFEEKTKRYNAFLERLWAIWEDRHVTLEELNELKEAVARDILLYAKEESTVQILGFLNVIANHAGSATLSDHAKTEIQQCVYGIINVLAKEIDLGGHMSDPVKEQLGELDRQIRPFLLEKEYRVRLKDTVDRILRTSASVSFGEAKYEKWLGDEYLWVRIEKSPVYLTLGPVAIYAPDCNPFIAFYVEFYENREFQEHRQELRGWAKDFLFPIKFEVPVVDFNKVTSVDDWAKRHQSGGGTDPTTHIATMMVDYVREWSSKSLTIRALLDECGYGNTETASLPKTQNS